MKTTVYELVDVTDSEIYRPVGVFLSVIDLENAVDNKKGQISDCIDNCEVFQIIEHTTGEFGYGGKRIKSFVRERNYNESNDEYVWSRRYI